MTLAGSAGARRADLCPCLLPGRGLLVVVKLPGEIEIVAIFPIVFLLILILLKSISSKCILIFCYFMQHANVVVDYECGASGAVMNAQLVLTGAGDGRGSLHASAHVLIPASDVVRACDGVWGPLLIMTSPVIY